MTVSDMLQADIYKYVLNDLSQLLEAAEHHNKEKKQPVITWKLRKRSGCTRGRCFDITVI